MDQAISVRGDVPPSLHPDVLTPLAQSLNRPGTIGHSAYVNGQAALADMYKAYAAIQDAEAALRAASTSQEVRAARGGGIQLRTGSEEELALAASKAFDRTAQSVDRGMGAIKKVRERLAAELEAVVTDPRAAHPHNISIGQEIRLHLKRLTAGARLELLMASVASNDVRTLSAVLTAPAYLSGLTSGETEAIRRRAASLWAPETATQLDAVDTTIERIMTASEAFVGRYADALANGQGKRNKANKALGRLADGSRS